MLALNMKVTKGVELEKHLKKHLIEGWSAGPSFLKNLDSWRNRACKASYATDGAVSCRETNFRYFAWVQHAAHHFRGVSLGEVKGVTFFWHDTFSASSYVNHPDWWFEACCVLFNCAAALSFEATSEDRGDPAGMRRACIAFQQAAGTVSHLRELVKDASWTERTVDMTAEFLDAFETLMLAQAQKCFYEKAVAEGKSEAILAKVSAEAAALYDDTAARLQTPRLQKGCSREWLDVVEWNRKLFDGMQHFHAAAGHLAKGEYGAQVSRLTHATNRCAEAVLLCKRSSEMIQEQFKRAHERCAAAHAKAKHDNDLVYTERVPAIATLPKLERACLVKKIKLPELDVPEAEDDTPAPPPPSAPPAPPPAPPPPAQPAAPLQEGSTPAPAKLAPMGGMIGALFGGGAKQPAPQPAASQPGAAAPTSGVASLSLEPPPPSFEEAQTCPPPPSYDEAAEADVDTLVSMGFPRADARRALAQAGGNVERAAEMLL